MQPRHHCTCGFDMISERDEASYFQEGNVILLGTTLEIATPNYGTCSKGKLHSDDALQM